MSLVYEQMWKKANQPAPDIHQPKAPDVYQFDSFNPLRAGPAAMRQWTERRTIRTEKQYLWALRTPVAE